MRYANLGELVLMNGDTPTSTHWKTWVLEEQMRLANYTVPVGFCTDFASIPFFARWYFRSNGAPWQRAAVVHDYLYSSVHGITRQQADRVYYYQARMDGTSKFKAAAMYLALRIGAGRAWNENRKRYRINPRWRFLRGTYQSPLWDGMSG